MKKLLSLHIAAIGIILIAALLRFWHVGEFFSFNFDEEYQATLAWSIVKDFHPIWIGVSASNVGYYLGPGFTYLNSFLFFLSQGDPLILGYFAAFLGVVTTTVLYLTVNDLFSKRAALFAAAFYGFSAFIIYFDRRFWNPSPIPLISILMVYSLIKGQKDTRWFILTAILVGLSLHVHLSLLIFFPIILVYVLKKIKHISFKTCVGMALSYLIITSPLLVFDFVHNFDNLLAPIRFFQNAHDPNHVPQISRIVAYITVFIGMLGRLWFLQPYTNIQNEHGLGAHSDATPGNVILGLLSLSMIVRLALRIKTDEKYRIIFLPVALFILSFILYPGVAGEYYLLGFVALFTVVFGLAMARMPLPISIPIMTIFAIVNMYTVFTTTQEPYGLKTRKEIVHKTMVLVGERSYYLETIGRDPRKYHPYGGWRYLFKEYGRQPDQSHADEFFGWIYPEEISQKKPELRVIVSEEKKIKPPQLISEFSHGAFTIYITKNL